jgi:transcriptional regulator GlxA family with amidase domain
VTAVYSLLCTFRAARAVERFARFLGQSPLAYLGLWRLQLAARLLETTDWKVLRVALEVGYESEAAFNRAFKREFALPPARYRRRHRQKQSLIAARRLDARRSDHKPHDLAAD